MLALAIAVALPAQIQFVDATESLGLSGISAARVVLVDLDGNTSPDAVIDRTRVFLNRPAGEGVRFVEVEAPNLPPVHDGDCLVFADVDNDGLRDAIITRHVTDKTDPVLPTAWCPGRGDGTFGDAIAIPAALPKTTACVAVGDVNEDGLLDLYLGNWYRKYGQGYEGYTNDLLIQQRAADGSVMFVRQPLAEDDFEFDEDRDAGGRPTYGAMIAHFFDDAHTGRVFPAILELNYGRRWNRLWTIAADASGASDWHDLAAVIGFDGDEIRHGGYPAWLKERAKTDPRFDRADELPFRSNGNTFDAAVGDIDNDGLFDVLVTEIAHGWAGESSDRTRILLRSPQSGELRASQRLSLDRLPGDPLVHNWNQGDLFGDFADFDLDGRLDVVVSSGDYPDNQRLRVWRQLDDGSLCDVTAWSGLDNDGSQQISLGDIDLDGDVDIIVGQSFFRYPASKKAQRKPTLKVYLNQAIERGAGNSLTILPRGDAAAGINLDGLGAVVRVEADLDGNGPGGVCMQTRQLVGIGGHAGKQHAFEQCFALGRAGQAERVTIWWPGRDEPTVLESVGPGRLVVRP